MSFNPSKKTGTFTCENCKEKVIFENEHYMGSNLSTKAKYWLCKTRR